LVAICILAGAGLIAYPLAYPDQIYPGVSVRGVDVGELTLEEATAQLVKKLPDPASEGIGLRAGELFWRLSWADAGQGFDYVGTAAAAYRVARDGPLHERALSAWQVRLKGSVIEPIAISADSTLVMAILEKASPLITTEAVEAELEIGPVGVVPSAGQSGTTLDLEASTARILQALGEGAAEAELVMVSVPPRLSDPEPAHTQARALLAQPFVLIADDPPTDYYAEFAALPERVATWLRAVPEYEQDSASMLLEIDKAAVRAWLLEVAPHLEPSRLLDVDRTLARTMAALKDGEHRAVGHIRHPEGRYIVQPGDYLFGIAYEHGFPQWRLEEANPDVDPAGGLEIGMELVIPSIDVLLSEPIAPGRLIEIDLPEQKLRAYEYDDVVYEFTCSSGMSSTPTIAGLFQVLMKEESAHAPRWDLDMPYFLGIYKEGPDFYNGIHELPIPAGGRRMWANDLGWPASYGCIILDIGDAEKLYTWAPVGTLVRITGIAPGTPTYEDRLEQVQQEAEAEAEAEQ
jgi:hypothetical protein